MQADEKLKKLFVMYPDIICMNYSFSRSTTDLETSTTRIVANRAQLGIWTRKNNTSYFTDSFRCFRLNKSVLQTTETKQADSQLHFAPKIIKIHLLVFENELIECHASSPKNPENSYFSHVWTFHACLGSLTNYLHSYMTKTRVFSFETFWN